MRSPADGGSDRREFLKRCGIAGASLLTAGSCRRVLPELATLGRTETVSAHVTVLRGAVNTALLMRDGAVLAIGGDPRANAAPVERVLFTHHRRDVVWAGAAVLARGTAATIPAAERNQFSGTNSFWQFFAENRFHDYVQPTTKVAVEPVNATDTVANGSIVAWRGLELRVLATPGYTRGAVSYLLDIDGKRIAFTGDLIYGDGRLLDLYSLQDAIPEARAMAYHGFMSRAGPLIASLRSLADQRPDILIPSRGPVIDRPEEAIERLVDRLQSVYRNYLSTTGLRWTVPERIPLLAARILGKGPQIHHVATAETRESLPPWLRIVGNSRLLVSESGAAFLIDCGPAFREVQELVRAREITAVEGIYITHYHDDHTENAQAARQAFGCPVYACEELRDILMNPRAYRMPAQTSNAIEDVIALADGATMSWDGFRLTSNFFPGQTLYHGSLVVERDGTQVRFIGDSFTPTGFGDECPQNRHFLRDRAGLLYCLDVLGAAPNTFLVNQHVPQLFRFSSRQIAALRAAYRQRRELLRALVPWDDPNYGLDEGWARCYPYEVRVNSGMPVTLAVRILNHSGRARIFRIRPHPPRGWDIVSFDEAARIASHQQADLRITIAPRASHTAGPSILTADVASDDFYLVQWVEAIVRVEA